jgi:hypothetical protein
MRQLNLEALICLPARIFYPTKIGSGKCGMGSRCVGEPYQESRQIHGKGNSKEVLP